MVLEAKKRKEEEKAQSGCVWRFKTTDSSPHREKKRRKKEGAREKLRSYASDRR
jgi:hypothetical protein